MTDDKVRLRNQLRRIAAIYRWTEKLRRKLSLVDAIETIDKRRSLVNDDDRYTLTLELKNFLLLAGRQAEAEQIIDEMIANLPDDVRFPISKASLYLYDKKQPQKALEAIDFAFGPRATDTIFSARGSRR